MSNQILFLGPRLEKKGTLGGVVILFEEIIMHSKKANINHLVVDTNLANYSSKFFGTISVLINLIFKSYKANHISLHGTAKDFIYLGPFVVLISKILQKKMSLRKFAGSFYEVYLGSNFLIKKIIEFVLRNSNFNFFETKYLILKFEKFNKNTFWWPNSRPKSNLQVSKSFEKRFVFISQIKKTKGIVEFIEASLHLDKSYVFDIYGPILCDEVESKFNQNANINYMGVLDHSEVLTTLLKYDVLILPTYHEGEGYPGIILEAFSIGMPVISTNWNSIPEIVIDNVNGLLVPIKDALSLKNAILSIDQNSFEKLRQNAIKSFKHFDSELVNNHFYYKTNSNHHA